ncbi:hypothetical protein [Bartonella sp. B1099]|uniref:hypothetical protein n=1 Tax=Bartonella sp. B1099 TaxID=2911422 RepID=UPI0020C3F433|nr:hypothetical protein [Bartonella sp. B1099]
MLKWIYRYTISRMLSQNEFGRILRDVSLKQAGEFATECHFVLHEGRALIKECDKQKPEASIEFIKYRFYFQTQLK